MSALLAKAADNLSETAIDDEIVVMNLENGNFYSLTGTGRAIWQLIDGSRTLDAIIAALAEEYSTSAAEIAAEVEAFVSDLTAAGLIRHA